MKKLGDTPFIHETAKVTQSTLGRYTEVGAHCHVAYSSMGDYSYCVGGTQIAYATIGKFSNIAANVRMPDATIGGYLTRHDRPVAMEGADGEAYTIDVDGTMRDFLAETAGSNIIWGVPYYGRIWPTANKNLNAPTLGYGSKAYTYVGHLSDANRHGRRWDDVGKVPWYRYRDGSGTWIQGYYDDPQSLGIKYDLGNYGAFRIDALMDLNRDDLHNYSGQLGVSLYRHPTGGFFGD